MSPVSDSYLGIDLAKATFDVCLLRAGQTWSGHFDNTPAGFKKLTNWLKKHHAAQVHTCQEATGHYGEALADYLHAASYTVSVINPVRLKGYARAVQARTKTDRGDAALLAEFCQRHQPEPWSPPAPERLALRELARRRASLVQMRQQETNRLKSGDLPAQIVASLEAVRAVLAEQIKLIETALTAQVQAQPALAAQHDLLTTIPGVATLTASTLLGEVDFAAFDSARQLAAYAGLTPSQHDSGTSVHGPAHLSKQGQVPLRRALFMPALSARQHNPTLQAFADQLEARGKPKLLITCAVMRKLLHLCFGVLRSGQPFDPNYPSQPTPAAQPAAQTQEMEVV
jgi:transposase